MSILAICVLIFAIVLLVLILVSPPDRVSQKALNILFLIMIILICLSGSVFIQNVFR